MCITYHSRVVEFARLWTSSSSQWMTDYFYEMSVLASSELISSDLTWKTHSVPVYNVHMKGIMSVWFGKFCFQKLTHLDIKIWRVTFCLGLVKMFLDNWTHNQGNHELGCSLAELFQGRPKMFRAGLINLLCDADNFSKIWFACSQYEIQHRERKVKNISTNICIILPVYSSIHHVQ
jgi:hypothetical protein